VAENPILPSEFETRYTIQNVSTGNYLHTDCSQGVTAENWNIVDRSTVFFMSSFRGSSNDVSLYLTMNSSGNVDLNTYCGNQELFTQTFSGGVYTLRHYNSSKYLVSNSDGSMGFSATNPGDGSQTWSVSSGTGTGNIWQNTLYSTYLHSDLDGHTVLNETNGSPTTDNLCNWTGSTAGGVFIQDATTTTHYLIDTTGSLSVGTLTTPPQLGFLWAFVPVGSNVCFQSFTGGYLQANGDGTTIQETSTGLWPGQLDDSSLWTITSS